jgi:hypothetical protein
MTLPAPLAFALLAAAAAPGPIHLAQAACAAELAQFRAIVDDDVKTGHLAASVHRRIAAEIDRAAAPCAAGRDAEARRMLAATKARYGYR